MIIIGSSLVAVGAVLVLLVVLVWHEKIKLPLEDETPEGARLALKITDCTLELGLAMLVVGLTLLLVARYGLKTTLLMDASALLVLAIERLIWKTKKSRKPTTGSRKN